MAVVNPVEIARPSPLDRLRQYARSTFLRGDLTALIITCALMALPALALSRVLNVPRSTLYWSVSLESLTLVAIASVIFGFLLARSHYGEVTALLLSAVYAIATIGLIQYLGAPGDLISRLGAIAGRLRGAIGGQQDPFLLVLFMSSLFWFLGHNTAWHVFRIDRVWRSVIPPGIVLLINGLYNFSVINLDPYLIAYLFFALMLVIRSHLDAREYEWYINQIRYDVRLRTWVLRVGAIAGVIALIIAWTLPTGSAAENQKRFQQFVNGDVFNTISKLAARLFSPLEAQGNTAADYYGRDELLLGGAIQLGDQIVLLVQAPQTLRYYWKSRTFDNYSNGRWTSQGGQSFSSNAQSGLLDIALQPYNLGNRQEVTQTITLVTGPSRLIYAAPQARRIGVASDAEGQITDNISKTLNVSVIRPKTPLAEKSTYTAISSISTASGDTLRLSAPVGNDAWLAPYRTVDASIAPRTRAEVLPRIIQGAITPYDKAKAIEQWLRGNIQYSETIPAPPTNRDLVDWVVFDQKQAYCTYYATAMVVMLRSLGIPARMAAGFSQGIYDPANKTYIVRERDAHTWVEVYFTGAGWVEFEPTSSQNEIGRTDLRNLPPTATPTFTPTPRATFTPTQPPTQPPDPDVNINQPTLVQPSPTPTPTATPVIKPPLPPKPDGPSPLLPILAFFGVLSAIVGTVAFLFVGIVWWVEYRGLDKLSPVGKAYARMAKYARWLRLPPSETATPLERGRKLAKELPDDAKNIAAITDMYIYERYGQPRTPTPQDEIRANRAWQATRTGLIRHGLRRWFRRK